MTMYTSISVSKKLYMRIRKAQHKGEYDSISQYLDAIIPKNPEKEGSIKIVDGIRIS